MRPINNAQHRTSLDVNGALISLMPNITTWYGTGANGWRHICSAPVERRFSSARRCCRRKDVSRRTCQTATQCERASSRDDDRARSTVHRCPPGTSTAMTPTPTRSTLQWDKKHSLVQRPVAFITPNYTANFVMGCNVPRPRPTSVNFCSLLEHPTDSVLIFNQRSLHICWLNMW